MTVLQRLSAPLLAALLGLAVPMPTRADEPAIAVVVAAGATPGRIGREQLVQIFKRKRRFWEDGSHIQPVNLPAGHPLRRAFSQLLYNRSPEELDDYWRDQYFHGVQPPYVLASEEAVIRLVMTTPGAIGYVSVCNLDQRVSVVWRFDGAPCPR